MKVYREETPVWKYDGVGYTTYEAARAAWLRHTSRSILDAAGADPEALRKAADAIDLLRTESDPPIREDTLLRLHVLY